MEAQVSILKSLSILTLLSASLSSFACLNDGPATICPGDPVVVDYLQGTVQGINPIRNQASVRFTNGAINTYSISRISLGKGCIDSVCVGDPATVDYLSGTVIALNQTNRKASIRFNNGAINTYGLSRVTVGKDCLQGYCVGDAATVDYLSGQIVGLNQGTMKVSVRFSNGATNTYSITRVSIGKGCILGYCVGDNATVDWLGGKIVAVNPQREQASIRFTNGQTNTYSLSRISTDGFCAEYGSHDRKRYISANEFGEVFSR